ncbi:MAG: uroporphyrinogen-III synthase [Rubinisphaera brasiliensis]|uniref:uroporphyrinogen-III synthase n=1 Tax=Rubinisphaera brasiliensis TaxID=119 RepID=UPI00391AA92B
MTVRVCSFESRRCEEMESMISRFGGNPTVAPSMREVPLEENVIAEEFATRLCNGEFEVVVFMTGVGASTLFEAVQKTSDWDQFHAALDKRMILVRGPKPVPVLRSHKVHIDYRAPEPNTWRELLAGIDSEQIDLKGKTVAIQEYGKPNQDFYDELAARGATVYPVPVYRWEFPTDLEPLNGAIRKSVETGFDVVMFTSANQVDNVLEAARRLELEDKFRLSLKNACIASIGPTCSERLVELGLPPAFEPSHPKMAHLIREALEFAQK